MKYRKNICLSIFFLFLCLTLFSCRSFFVSGNISASPQEDKRGVYLTDEEVTLYMGYNAAIYSGDVNKAQQFLEKLVENHPERTDFATDLIGLYLYKKNTEAAMDIVNKVLEKEPENLNVLSMLADIYVMKGRKKDAIATLEKVLFLDKNRGNIPVVLANLYFQERDYEKVVSLLTDFVKERPDNFLAYIYLGKAYEMLGKNSEAAEAYEKALKEREEDEILITLDSVYDKLGEKEKSIEVLEKFLERNPDYPKVRERLALLYMSVNNYEKALANLEQLIQQYPENKDLLIKFGIIAIDGGFYEKATEPLMKVLKIEPANQKALYFMGVLHKEKREWDKAIGYFEKISDKDYEKSAIFFLSVCYEKIGKKDKALSVLKDYWEKEHDEEAAYYIALYYKNNNDYDNAKKMLTTLLDFPHYKNKAILLIAEIHLKTGEFEKGISLVQDLLKEQPDNPDALNFIGYSYVERNMRLEEAEKMLLRALELKPDDPYIMDSVAWLYYMKKDYTKALEIQRKVVTKVKDDATILEHMGDILMAVGEKSGAKEYYKRAIEAESENIDVLKKKLEELKDF